MEGAIWMPLQWLDIFFCNLIPFLKGNQELRIPKLEVTLISKITYWPGKCMGLDIYMKKNHFYTTTEIQCKTIFVLPTPPEIMLSNPEKKSWPYCTFIDILGSFNNYYSSWKNWKICLTISACLKYKWAMTINIG